MNSAMTFFWGSVAGSALPTMSLVAGMRAPSEAFPASSMYFGSGSPWHWKSGVVIPSWALFLATMDPTGPMVQVMIAWGDEFFILVSCAVISVSEGPNDSLAV